ncbi:MAG: carbon-nitrogen hydrolase family protein [Pseudomonadota bacterium]
MTQGGFRAACIQITSGPDPEANLKTLDALIRQAAADGAALVLTPETSDLMAHNRREALATARPEADHGGVERLAALAAKLGIWLSAGSLVVKVTEERLANRSFLFDPAGRIAARYDKIHMFDVEIPDGTSYRESRSYRPGDRLVLADLPWGRLGLTICYDLRFPQLYRALAQAGADFLIVPSAFTRYTGRAHWETLLRARAIETGCFVFAAAQCGDHEAGRKTYGHSLIVDPWGQVLADGGDAVGAVSATIDPSAVARARRMIPALAHGRPYELSRRA